MKTNFFNFSVLTAENHALFVYFVDHSYFVDINACWMRDNKSINKNCPAALRIV